MMREEMPALFKGRLVKIAQLMGLNYPALRVIVIRKTAPETVSKAVELARTMVYDEAERDTMEIKKRLTDFERQVREYGF